jgi:radical SAM superfamily enzyme YgiQ (UPF0313 family)
MSFKGLAPPLGLLYIAKILEKNGDDVAVFDFAAESFSEEKVRTAIQTADVVGMTVLSFSLSNAIEIIKLIKKIKPQIHVVIGGPHCTLFPKESLEVTQADISVQGEGEDVILSIKNAIKGKINFSKIPGIYYRDKNKIKKGASIQLIKDLNTIPFPNRAFVQHYIYGQEYNPKIKKGEFTSIITSRGCPFSCKFCSRNTISMKEYRIRSPKNVFEEIKELNKQGFKYLIFVDDSFLSNRKQAHEIFDKIIEAQLDMSFIITGVRVDAADKKLFEKMKKAGVTHLYFGLESGNQEVLDFYNKKTTLDKIRYAVNLSHDLGFFNVGSFIFGAPIETKNHFQKTISFAKTLPLDSVSFLPLDYVAGSELWYHAVHQGKISEEEYMVRANSKRGLGIFTPEEIELYSIKAQRDFYLRPSFIIRLLTKSLQNDGRR